MKKITILLSMFLCWQAYSQINPIEVTGFNVDVIANGVGNMSESTTAPVDNGSRIFLSADWKLNEGDDPITVGLPATGLIVSPNTEGLTYQIPTAEAPYESNNALSIPAENAGNNGTLTFTTPLHYSELYVLVTSARTSTMNVTVNFEDDSTQEFPSIEVKSWFSTGDLPIEVAPGGRGNFNNNAVETYPDENNTPKMFQMKLNISIENQVKQVKSITFTHTDTGTQKFSALAVSGKDPGCFVPFDVAISDITASNAEITWNSHPTITTWEIEFGETGFELGSGTIIQDTDGTIGETLTPLNAGTEYQVYVRSVCEGDPGDPTGPITFTTPPCPNDIEAISEEGMCGAIVTYTTPESEGFMTTQTNGIASGEVFPVGTTTNTFEITEGDNEPLICSFNVVVLDIENPVAITNNITIVMDEDGTVSLTPEDINNESTDNCEIESMSLDIVSLNCDNLGENEVTLTLTDASGNTASATATVTLTDPNLHCELSLTNFNDALDITVYPNPAKNKIVIEAGQEIIKNIQVFSVYGQLVKEFVGNNKIQVEGDISELSTGIYFVKVNSGSGYSSVKKIIKK